MLVIAYVNFIVFMLEEANERATMCVGTKNSIILNTI